MSRQLPPLKAVRAFEAAARYSSFVSAADELAVTPSAISQQVKALEQWMGCDLFRRHARGLETTREGRDLLPSLTDALDEIEQASTRIRQRKGKRMLTVTCLASLAALWLTPRLHRFSTVAPGVDVSLATFERVADLEKEDIDLAIRHTARAYEGFHVEDLMTESLGVVCSPDLLTQSSQPLRTLEDLQHQNLLHDSATRAEDLLAWPTFLKRLEADGLKVPKIDTDRGMFFTDSHMIVQACLSGRGVMIGRSVLIEEAMATGLLVAPFGMQVEADARYKLVMRKGALEDSRVLAFRNWLYAEVGRDAPEPSIGGA